jgi:hypothetical protein
MSRRDEETGGVHCPKCGRYCSEIIARLSERGIASVSAECAAHGRVDVTDGAWNFEEFAQDELALDMERSTAT